MGLAAVLNVWFWPIVKEGAPYQLAAYPSMLFMMFLMLRMSSDRRKAMEARYGHPEWHLRREERSPGTAAG